MKNLIVVAMVFLLFTCGFAQDNTNDSILMQKNEKINLKYHIFKPTKNDIGFSFHLNGLINSIALQPIKDVNENSAIMFKTYYQNEMAFRLGFGLHSWNNRFSKLDSIGLSLVDSSHSYKKINFYFAPGIEKHFDTPSRLDPFIGVVLNIGILGKTREKSELKISDTTGTATVEVNTERAGGTSFGVSAITGFDYFFSEKFAIGAEYTFGFNSNLAGGDWEIITTDTPVSGTGSTNRQLGSEINTSSGFKVNSFIEITLSYFFNRKTKENSIK